MSKSETARLYGIGPSDSNRDFSNVASWGKNIFNATFPTALALYMLRELKKSPATVQAYSGTNEISIGLLQKLSPEHALLTALRAGSTDNDKLYFRYEGESEQMRKLLPKRDLKLGKTDLVVEHTAEDMNNKKEYPLEVKLTAVPDSATESCPLAEQSCELVLRPPTIVQLALQIASRLRAEPAAVTSAFAALGELVVEAEDGDYGDGTKALKNFVDVQRIVHTLLNAGASEQQPAMLHTIYRTDGTSGRLAAGGCLDTLIWTDIALAGLVAKESSAPLNTSAAGTAARPARSLLWLAVLMHAAFTQNTVRAGDIIDKITLGKRNDKAVAFSGHTTIKYIKGEVLETPRVCANAIPEIILGGGHRNLSPERRLDAIISGCADSLFA